MSNHQQTEYNKVVMGLDIGTSKVVAIVGTLNENGKLKVLGLGKTLSEGVINGQVVNMEKTAAAINTATQAACMAANVDIDEINVCISGPQIMSKVQRNGITRTDKENEISVVDLDRLVDETFGVADTPSGYKALHALPQRYYIDGSPDIYDPVGRQGIRLESDFNIISATLSSILNINRCLSRNKIKSDNLYQSGLASALAVLTPDEMEVGVVLVDIGAGSTEILMFHGKVLRHLAVLPFGGSIITKDIEHGCSIQEKQAELVKLQVGNAIPENVLDNQYIAIPGIKNRAPKEISVRNLSRIIGARYEELIEIIDNEISNSGWASRIGTGIVVTGGGALLAGTQQLFETMTGFEFRIGYPNEHIGKSRAEGLNNPAYSTAIGLTLAGFMHLDGRDYNNEQSRSTPVQPAKKSTGTKSKGNSNAEGSSISSIGILKTIKNMIIDDDNLPDKY